MSIQNFGAKYRQVSWSGWFEGNDAYDRMIKIGNMRQKGDPVELKTEKHTQTYVIKEYLPEYRRDTFIPFTITLLPIIETKPRYEDYVDKIIRKTADSRRNGDKYVIFDHPPRIGSETPFQLILDTNDGGKSSLFHGFMYSPNGGARTAYVRNGLMLLRYIECVIEKPYGDSYYKVRRNGKDATVSRLIEGDYAKFDCIQLEDLKALGMGVEYGKN